MEKITPVNRLFRLLKPDSKEIRNVYVYAIFNGLVALTLPLGIQAIVNLIQGGSVSTSWIVLVCIVVFGVAASGLLRIAQLRITENLQQKIFTRAAFEFAYRIPKIKLEELYNKYAPELMNRFFDVISIQKGLSKILIDFSAAGLQVIFGLLLLSFYHPFFIIFSLILIALVFAIFRFTSKRGLLTSLRESKYKYEVVYWLEEIARTSNAFKLAGKTSLHLEKTDKNVGNYLREREAHFKVLVRQYYLLIIFNVVVASGLLALGGILVMEQLMNIGQFIAAEIIVLLIMNSVEKLIVSLETIYDVLTSVEKIAQVTDLEIENEDGIDLQKECDHCGLSVKLERLSFAYPEQEVNTLKSVDLEIESGEKIVIAGENGSGKSTLLQIIGSLYVPTEGMIFYNNVSQSSLDLCSVHTTIGDAISQEDLFEGTIVENITMGRPAASIENVKWAIEKLGLGDYVSHLPKGYDTILDPTGRKIPRSISQKLLLARSIVIKPKLLLLEDAFEHFEVEERQRIVDFLTDKENEWTMVAVSSDPYLSSKVDRVLIMKEGKILNPK
ncbi:MAG: ATP-binding cassette domain-containing protein [Crocinitomicaceae bacterium]|nr:ATP-binding cassette domain-containing protein [Crocinitomicaceae bacterium]